MYLHLALFKAIITVISLNLFSYSDIATVDSLSTMEIQAVDAADSLALVALYDNTSGTNWINQTNWKSIAPVSEWYGVTVSNGRVTELRLNNNALDGTIPTIFTNLTALKILDINSDTIQGITSLDGMTALERLHLNNNRLTSLPELNTLTNLTVLEVNNNDLTSLPDLSALTSLSRLECKNNENLGNLPPSLSSLKTLISLETGNSGLQSLPSLDSLLLLQRLIINRNNFTSVPDLNHLTNLTSLGLEATRITTLPLLPSSLQQLACDGNQLTEINQIANLPNLTLLNCGGNQLDSLPSTLSQLTSLITLYCDRNVIQSLPQLSSLTNLKTLWCAENQIQSLPDLSQLNDLEQLNFRDNSLTELPPLSTSGNIWNINVNNNNLVSLPSPTVLPGLTELDVQNNHLEFGYLEPYVPLLASDDFTYTPQDSVGLPSLIIAEPRTKIELYAQNGGTNTSYTWYKVGDPTPLSNEDTLVFDPIQYADGGSYYYRATNPEFPITLVSRLRTINTANIGREIDSLALVVFYNSTSGPQWTNDSNWLTTAPLEDWYGVTVENDRVTQIILNSNNLTDTVPTEINLLTELTWLDISQNTIEHVISLDSLKKLNNLMLYSNNIQSFPSWEGLEALLYLRVSSNPLSSAFPSLANNSSLYWLGIRDLYLESLPDLTNNTSLQVLRAGNNKISTLTDLSFLSNLRDLRVEDQDAGFKLTEIPWIGNLDSLEALDVSANEITSLSGIENLTKLELLRVGNNNISSLPDLSNLIQLTELKANDNTLTSLPALNAPNLEVLTVDQNDIAALPDLSQFPELVQLGASYNNLTTITGLESLTKLQTFFVPNNQIESIPSLENLSNLESFSISSNQLQEIQGLENLSKLKLLHVYVNQLQTLEGVEALISLEEFSAHNNRLISLPNLEQLVQLKELYLQNNNLSVLPPMAIDSLDTLDCSNNRLGFESLEPFLFMRNDPNYSFTYSPQKKVDPEQFITAYIDSSATLSTTVGGTNSQYQWYFNNVLLSGETSDSLTIAQVSASDSGAYHVSIQNSDFPDLTLTTQSKHLRIYNAPVQTDNTQSDDHTGNRINVEIPSEASDSVRSEVEETLKRFGSIKLDSCLCNALEVWSLPDTITETLPNGNVIQYVGEEESIAHAKKETEVETGNDTVKIDRDYAGIGGPTPSLGEEDSPYRADFEGRLELEHDVIVAVIDYGIDSTHSSIQPFVRLANNSENYECENTNGQGYAFTPHDPNSNPWTDSLTHGTHVSGIITQLIPNLPVKLMSLKIGTPGRRGRIFELACALKYAIDHGAQVINMSVGYQGARSELLNKLLRETEEAGIIVVASAGNDTADNDIIPHWPSNLNLSNTISVAAIDPVLYETLPDLADFSNYGDSTVLLAAPGVGIFSSVPGEIYAPKSGTSIAAACVTAVVAAILADDNTLSPNSVKELLTSEGIYWQPDPVLDDKVISGGKLNLKVENCNRVPQVEPDRISMTVGQEITFNPGANDCKSAEAIISLNDGFNVRWGQMEFDPITGNINYLALGVGIDSLTYEVCGTDTCVQEKVYIEVLGIPCVLPSIPVDDQGIPNNPDPIEIGLGDTLLIIPAPAQCGSEGYLPYLVDGAYSGNMWVAPAEKRIVYVPNELGLDAIYYQMCGIENCHRVLIRVIDREASMGRSRVVSEPSIQKPTLFYPNPANEKISVAFDVLNSSSVQFQIKDLMGRTLLSSDVQTLSNGRHEIDLGTNELKAGIYLAHIKIGDRTKTQKIMIVK